MRPARAPSRGVHRHSLVKLVFISMNLFYEYYVDFRFTCMKILEIEHALVGESNVSLQK